ncbi:NADPH:quinone reductase [Streptomyces sp. KK5PA1]|uniref:NADPH:quinone reductase n=2 Tax=Actinacidiphila acididurans TaxID=2784346 RepID=A0ABS2U000_9ACTN|nr:NADPH:quinone reductase [Actinacidiphila acididurans]
MKAVVYARTGAASEVLRVVERDVPAPGPGEVRVEVAVSGLNPIDFKLRQGSGPSAPVPEIVPHQDGAGTVDALGSAVEGLRVGQRVWLREAAFRRLTGTAQEYTVVPAHLATPLPDGVSFEAGASIGIPAMTAHRALTVHEDAPARLRRGSLAGAVVLVAGGAGAVGHASIQLARWAGAEVIATASSSAKGDLALASGAHHVVRHRAPGSDPAARIRELAPDGVDVIVEVAPSPNARLNAAVARRHGCVAVYADTGGGELTLPVGPHMFGNLRYQFLITFEMRDAAKANALAAVTDALGSGALPVGEEAGLPLIRYALEDTAHAHEALEGGVTGKVLILP